MADAIRAIAAGSLAPVETLQRAAGVTPSLTGDTKSSAASGPGFSDVLKDAITEARANERVSDDLADRFAAGDPSVGIHETMIASEKASISLRFAITLKNRVMEAYRELMNTSV